MLAAALLAAALAACQGPESSVRRETISEALTARAGAGIALEKDAGDLPPDVDLSDGLARTEAVSLALWKSPDFAADLAEIEVARAHVAAAGLFHDPVFSFLLPLGPKQYESTLSVPLEALWQRDDRIAVAEGDAQALAQRLVAHGLDLVRDTERSFDALVTARERARLAAELADAQRSVSDLERSRLEAGDIDLSIFELAEHAARVGADLSDLRQAEVERASVQLAARLGLALEELPAELTAPTAESGPLELERSALIEQALAFRPEVRAAELDIEAAAARAGLARAEAWRISALVDTNEEANDTVEVGPGLEMSIPLFGGARAAERIARAEIERAARKYQAVRRGVVREVDEALIEMRSSSVSLERWRDDILPRAERMLATSRAAYDAGQASRLDVLLAQVSWLQAVDHQVEVRARTLAADSDLARAVGGRKTAGADS
jgi:outer membrane protein, heavy metal efflux system